MAHAKPNLVNVVVHPLALFRATASAVNPNAIIMIGHHRTADAILETGIGGVCVWEGAEDSSCALFFRSVATVAGASWYL